MVRLDDTQTRANLAIVSQGARREWRPAQAREEAERDGCRRRRVSRGSAGANQTIPTSRRRSTASASNSRSAAPAREGQRPQLRERIAQLHEEIRGYEAQIVSKDKQIDWITKELNGVNELWAEESHPLHAGDGAGAREGAARRRARSADRRRSRRPRARSPRPSCRFCRSIRTCAPRSARTSPRSAPRPPSWSRRRSRPRISSSASTSALRIDGIVHQLTVHTVGGVITAGRGDHADRSGGGRARGRGQGCSRRTSTRFGSARTAVLRFSAFNQRTTPELNGEVNRVSADVSEDQKTGARYYTVRIAVPAERDRAARRPQARARHAGRGLHSDQPAHRDVLSGQAAARPDHARVSREISRPLHSSYVNSAIRSSGDMARSAASGSDVVATGAGAPLISSGAGAPGIGIGASRKSSSSASITVAADA